MSSEDERRHPESRGSLGEREQRSAWIRWFRRAERKTENKPIPAATPTEHSDVLAALQTLPTSLDGSLLPNGVVELLIEDAGEPVRQLFDIHNGHITLLEPGKCVPWTSIAGSAAAWTMALGPAHDTGQLQLTGDVQLARRVLQSLPRCH